MNRSIQLVIILFFVGISYSSWSDAVSSHEPSLSVDKASLEFDAKGATLEEHAQAHYLNHATTKAPEAGRMPCYWANSYSGDGGVTLFDRNTSEVVQKDALYAIIDAGE